MDFSIFSAIFSPLMNKQLHFNKLLHDEKFVALAIDQGTSLKDIIKEKKGKSFTQADYYYFKKQIALNLGVNASSILFDYDTYMSDTSLHSIETSKIIAFEDDAYNIDNKSRITLLPKKLHQDDEIIKDFSAVKFFMYFNPDSDPAINNEKFKVIKHVGQICNDLEIPYLFEPLLYFDERTKIDYQSYLLKKPIYIKYLYQEFSHEEYQIDIIKIEFPFNEFEVNGFQNDGTAAIYSYENCSDIMRECFENGSTPFVFLSAGMKFNNFLHSLELAKSSKIDFLGFLCGRSIWQDSIDIFCKYGEDKFLNWINEEGQKRLQKLKNSIINN